MRTREKVELSLIPVATALVWFSGDALPKNLGTGSLVVTACLTWLVQGGVRDAWLLYLLKTRPPSGPRRRLACMCLESSAGFAGVVAGLALAWLGVGGDMAMTATRWTLLVGVTLVTGFLLKDFIITWRPLGLRRDPEHHTIIFTWR